jgi:hypothetical protein
MCDILQKNPIMMNVVIRARENITKYAPSTPEIAPDAPTAGIGLLTSPITWARPATIPQMI